MPLSANPHQKSFRHAANGCFFDWSKQKGLKQRPLPLRARRTNHELTHLPIRIRDVRIECGHGHVCWVSQLANVANIHLRAWFAMPPLHPFRLDGNTKMFLFCKITYYLEARHVSSWFRFQQRLQCLNYGSVSRNMFVHDILFIAPTMAHSSWNISTTMNSQMHCSCTGILNSRIEFSLGAVLLYRPASTKHSEQFTMCDGPFVHFRPPTLSMTSKSSDWIHNVNYITCTRVCLYPFDTKVSELPRRRRHCW